MHLTCPTYLRAIPPTDAAGTVADPMRLSIIAGLDAESLSGLLSLPARRDRRRPEGIEHYDVAAVQTLVARWRRERSHVVGVYAAPHCDILT